MSQLSPRKGRGLFDFAINRVAHFTVAALLIGIWVRLQRVQSLYEERSLLQSVGNPGFSPAAAAVQQLYREGKLFGEESLLRGKNVMSANWQRVILPKVNMTGINLDYADLRRAMLYSASFSHASFRNADLQSADLRGAHLVRANFMEANLRGTNLIAARAKRASFFIAQAPKSQMHGIDLDHADLAEANFRGADLSHAHLTYALLRDTDFADANLKKALLINACLVNANLIRADLTGARFNEKTMLPDAKWVLTDEYSGFDKYWTPETDMESYTNPRHPDFWQPEWAVKYNKPRK